MDETKEILKKAVTHKGYALVDIFQPCVSFNKINTFQWFKEHTYYLDDSHKVGDRNEAFKKAIETEKLPLGVFYTNTDKATFEENIGTYKEDKRPLYQRDVNVGRIRDLLEKFKTLI